LPASYRLSGPGIYYATETYTYEDFYIIYISKICHYSLLSTSRILCYKEIHKPRLPEDFHVYSMLQRHSHNKTIVRFLHWIFYVKTGIYTSSQLETFYI
jgi:hypothetical protein